MKILELKDIEREEGAIYYFRKYEAIAVIELPKETVSIPITFTIESGPLGDKKIDVKILKAPSYPIHPIIVALKTYILETDKEGLLPK